ncbi:hypothetical protein [Paraburkholderia atlantica]|nr:hypothetical protein [Paraburkholderia atlantica]MBB5508115.1 hypothetical protein [Paraburkholderia atlantica]
MNQYIIPAILAYAALVMLALAFNHGAHRKESGSAEIDELHRMECEQ